MTALRYTQPMRTSSASAPGKIILAGEYAVLFGLPGLAVPSAALLHVELEEEPSSRTLAIKWPQAAKNPEWEAYVRTAVQLLEKHRTPVRGILKISSDVPLGKGMGSSTALVVALARCLLGNDCERMARSIEDRMNPGHSGLDFAVIWHGKPIRYVKNQKPQIIDRPFPFLDQAKLIDTGIPQESTPELVAWVRSREENLKESLRTIGACADRLIDGENPITIMREQHRAQVSLGVVPKKVQALIEKIEKSGGAAKVIGAGARTGGGGMVLAIGIRQDDIQGNYPVMAL